MKKLFRFTTLLLLVAAILLSVAACGEQPTEESKEPGIYTLSTAFDVAVKNGFTGTLSEFVEAVRGLAIEFRTTDTVIQWRYEGTEAWYDLVTLAKLVGPKGEKGDKGDKGDPGEKGDKGDKGDAGRGILNVEIRDGALWITYTDAPDHPVKVGEIGELEATPEGLDFYPLPDGTYGVMGGKTAFLEKITIPATHNGKAVTRILPRAFYEFTNLTDIVLADGITNMQIDEYAFDGCTSLMNFSIPNSITDIDIDWTAFLNCTQIRLTVEGNIGYFGNAENPYLLLVVATVQDAGSYTIHEGTKIIGERAFSGCKNIRSITIPNGVTRIKDGAFWNCTNLESVTFPDGVVEIGEQAFENCSSLISVNLPSSIESIGAYAFHGCYAAEYIQVPQVATVGEQAFTRHRARCGRDGCEICHLSCTHVDTDKNAQCDICRAILIAHVDTDSDDKCDGCGRWMNTIFTWDTTDLLYRMTNSSNNQELPSGCERYLAGEGTYDTRIDKLVRERNLAAEEYAKVEIAYLYYPDNSKDYNWSAVQEKIVTEINSGSSSAADMYCNFVYDMMNASLKGVFANLKTTLRANHFEFAKDRLYATEVGDAHGYMYEYMQSLTLNQKKMYLLSSDYFTDMVRAFYVVPVSRALFESLNQKDLTSDLNKDGTYDIDDLFQLVKNKDWTYDALIKYSGAAYQPAADSTSGKSLKDRLGFAVSSSSGLSSSGLLYTTSVTIIEREWNEDKTESTDTYPIPNDAFVDFCSRLSKLFGSSGVLAVSNPQANAAGYTSGSLQAIRDRFVENMVLFGGVICVGSLEYDAYQGMKENGGQGFGVVPVPLYKQDEEHTENYLTQVHNLGRVGAVSNTTTKFAQCTAFLDYQSRHSHDILEQYYNTTLTYGVAGGEGLEGNVEMLELIRANVRSSFDKAFEDAIGFFYQNVNGDSDTNRWNVMIQNAGYQLDDAATRYKEVAELKQNYLNQLKNSQYDQLPA